MLNPVNTDGLTRSPAQNRRTNRWSVVIGDTVYTMHGCEQPSVRDYVGGAMEADREGVGTR